MALHLITPPTVEPVTLAEAKVALRVEDSLRDALITGLIEAAREHAEHHTGLAFVNQTWELRLDAFPAPGDDIVLGKGPVASITSIFYVDTSGVEQTLATSVYALDVSGPGYARLKFGQAWPGARVEPNAVRVRFVAGYGASGAAVPELIRQWINMHVGSGLKAAESFASGISVTALPNRYVDALLDPYRLYL
jgi:uncharacterized phiE125 gp8 family phage protein